ncbi:TonB-dependent siderophore receptor [Pseudoxanthomonas mexicana]|uniref:TonB-dependent siderophore receptor n=1 Tax=Pseudoxanthomonas mexicana TaxID=128785 RepID=A0A7G9T9U6_PSEMX|nr:TonB-dependent siderophore receptor [Pseudoxanthomonas mexicana]
MSGPRTTRKTPVNPLSQLISRALYGAPLALVLSTNALAQQATAQDATTLDGIEVVGDKDAYQVLRISSATKTDTPLRDVPQSVTVISQGLIRDQAMQNMGDVVRYVPGVQMAQGEGHRDAPILRGNTSTADFFIDGLRDDVQYYRDLYNVERVEVLKGPGGMIFGRDASGGLINRVTKQADWSNARNLGLTVGSWDSYRVTGDVDQALNDSVAVRVTGFYEDSDSFRDEVTLERWAVNPTLTWRLSDDTQLEVGYEHFEDDRVTDRGVPSYLGRPLRIDEATFFGSAELSPTWAEIDALTARVRHEFSPQVTLVNQTRVANYDKFYQNVFPGAYTAATNRVAISAYNNLTERKNILNQTDLTAKFATGAVQHTLLAGLELGRQETDNFRQTGYFPTAPQPAPGQLATSHWVTLPNTYYTDPVVFTQSGSDANNNSVAKTAAVYVQDQIEFSPHWQALLGVRFDRFEADLYNRRNNATLSSSDDLVSPRAGLIYKPTEATSIYASYAISYVPRAGEQLASLSISNRALDPEKFTNKEVGFKWDIHDALSFTAALYQLDRTNVAITDPLDATRLVLVDGQRVKGLELGLAGNLTEQWQVMAGYAYQDSQVQTPGAQNGNQLGQVPENSFSLWNRYDFTPRFGAGLGVIYRDDVFVSSDQAVVLPSFTRVDAAVYYAITPSLRLQANIENLLDEEYYASAHSNTNIMPGTPRALRVGIDWRF